MKLAVLSGKGGTGKTTVSSNLAFITKSLLIDTDIEEPNSHIFLKPKNIKNFPVNTMYPEIDMERCILCGNCGDFCRFNAIIPSKKKVLVFEESCHDCGGCKIICRAGAINYCKREIGEIFVGETYFNSPIKYGKLNIGEMSGVKIIKELYKTTPEKDFIIDCPPGTSCTTVASVEESDFAIIVTEPSPFGLSDMKLVIELLQDMKIPFGIVINKSIEGNTELKNYCNKNSFEILGEIPFDKDIAKTYSKGEIICDTLPQYREIFENILKKIPEVINNEI
ncbi:MAG: ATP-binding protein [Fusobacterium perfoetens]|uniref:ATP-binding protein n=1 Tax=Fusobacterium perfoetens TaxID=852 RepID=UPI0023F28250|nr:ATP-binding protein [Fusobacterium perfoetens]MCI6151721.1 ATP-binding protein [Fusobacterium perfoetens]MDY3237837.1 ATP-binding protein [Fusobacterium perfoetens]